MKLVTSEFVQLKIFLAGYLEHTDTQLMLS
jgi:hypothetical protein